MTTFYNRQYFAAYVCQFAGHHYLKRSICNRIISAKLHILAIPCGRDMYIIYQPWPISGTFKLPIKDYKNLALLIWRIHCGLNMKSDGTISMLCFRMGYNGLQWIDEILVHQNSSYGYDHRVIYLVIINTSQSYLAKILGYRSTYPGLGQNAIYPIMSNNRQFDIFSMAYSNWQQRQISKPHITVP